MTTKRRTKQEQIRDALRELLKKQDRRVILRQAGYEQAEAEASRTRRALAELGMEPLPGREALVAVEVKHLNFPSPAVPTTTTATGDLEKVYVPLPATLRLLPAVPCKWGGVHPHTVEGTCMTGAAELAQ